MPTALRKEKWEGRRLRPRPPAFSLPKRANVRIPKYNWLIVVAVLLSIA